MKKNNFLLVDLNESKTKKLAETITSDTSRKILNFLTEKEHDTEANIAEKLSLPISTVHYHLAKLMEAGLIIVEEFHYSKKGREVNHYKLANKYIIIAPRKISGLKQALRNVLPVAVISLGIAAVIKLVQSYLAQPVFQSLSRVADESAEMLQAAPKMLAETTPQVVHSTTPDIALIFLIGSFTTILIYLIVMMIKEKMRK